MRRLLPFVVFLLLAGDARASCIPPEPRRQIRSADAAFVGRFESQRGPGTGERWLTFRVEQVVKGTLGATVEIHELGISSISLPSFAPGDRVGLMMNRVGDEWRSQCQQADPDELADATTPIPRPPGRGRAAFLVSGSSWTAWLDRRGRALAYGPGARVAAVCAGGRRLVTLGPRRLTIRRTRDLEVLGERSAPSASAAHCVGDDVYVAGSKGLYRGSRRVWTGTWTGVAFAGRSAFVLRDHALLRVDLRTGRERAVAEVPLSPQHEPLRTLAVRAGHVAIVAPNHSVQGGEPPSKLAMVDLRTGAVRTTDLGASDVDGEVVWLSDDRFAFLGTGSSLFFDAGLHSRGSLAGWTVRGALAVGDALLGIAGHRVERGSPSGHSELSRLPSSQVYGLFGLGRGVDVRLSRRVPRF